MNARVRQFALLGIPLLLIFLFLYPYMLQVYCPVVLGVSGVLLELFRPPIELDVRIDGTWVVSMSVLRHRLRFVMNRESFTQEVDFLGLAILPALVLATPVGMAARVRLLLMALILLFVVHVLSLTIVISALAKYCHGRANGRTCEVIGGALSPWSQITTFGIWGLLTWRYWFGRSKGVDGDGSARLPAR